MKKLITITLSIIGVSSMIFSVIINPLGLIELNWLTFAVSISAFTYSVILTEQNMILYKPMLWSERNLPEWLHLPLIGCQYCVSGQWALWFYFYITLCQNESNYFIWLHLWFICQTIFITKIITFFYFKFLAK